MADTDTPQDLPEPTAEQKQEATAPVGALDEFDGDDIVQYVGELIPEGEDPNYPEPGGQDG